MKKRNTSVIAHLFIGMFFIALFCSGGELTNDNAAGERAQSSSLELSSVSGVDNVNENSTYKGYEVPAINDDDDNIVILQFLADSETGEVNYTCAWNRAMRANLWSAYTLNDSNSMQNVKRSATFYPTSLLAVGERSTDADYKQINMAIDRGHLVPSSDRLRTETENAQTFCFANIAPQWHKHNISGWRRIENLISKTWNSKAFRDTLYIAKGATLDSTLVSQYTPTGLPISDYWWAAVVAVKDTTIYEELESGLQRLYVGPFYYSIAFIIPHENKRIYRSDYPKAYAVTVDSLETFLGLDLFPNLPDTIETSIEANMSLSLWGLE